MEANQLNDSLHSKPGRLELINKSGGGEGLKAKESSVVYLSQHPFKKKKKITMDICVSSSAWFGKPIPPFLYSAKKG